MKRIPLRNRVGEVVAETLVDDCDAYLCVFPWRRHKTNGGFYAVSNHETFGPSMVYIHRVILGVTGCDFVVDHKNLDTLDNRRENLRICTRSENQMNRRKSSSRTFSVFKGVSRTVNDKWRAFIKLGRQVHLGVFDSEEHAAVAYDIGALVLFGDFALLNGVQVPGVVRDEISESVRARIHKRLSKK